MITFEMLTAAIYSLVGLAALVTMLTQIFKNWWSKNDKKWVNHLLSFVASIICCGAVLFIGAHWGIGVFAAFCFACLDSWLMFIGTVIGCALTANGLWSYEYMQMFLEWIKLLPQPVSTKVLSTPTASVGNNVDEKIDDYRPSDNGEL